LVPVLILRLARLGRSPGDLALLCPSIVLHGPQGTNLSSRECADCFAKVALHFFHLDMPVMVASLVVV
jgi:hypothetical protein